MQKTRKQLLGIAGLAAVAVMTAIACALPSPDASALTDAHGYGCDNQTSNECASDDDNVNLNVTVREGNYTARFVKPRDNAIVTNTLVDVEITYDQVDHIETTIEYTDGTTTISQLVDTYTPTNDYGTRAFQIDTASYNSSNQNYKLILRAYNAHGSMREDTVTFSYRAVAPEIKEPTEGSSDPNLEISVDDDVEKVVIHVYDKNGNPLFVNDKGEEVPIVLDRSAIDPKTGKLLVQLPFEQYGAQPGDYTIIVSGYDADGQIVSMVTMGYEYAPETPETPNTGALFGDLNITRIDYILTGLIAFSLVAGFAFYLVCRKNHR